MEIQKIKKLPDEPGVYFFKKNQEILYIGKATSIRDRVRSYFSKDLMSARGPLLVRMISEANNVSFKKTDSVLEALILEANLIKKYQPSYNTKEKDNKSFNYIVITREDYPRILIVRGRDLSINWDPEDIKWQFGPFPKVNELKEALKIIRKIFPYSDKCRPGAKKPCFDFQIGKCPGVCTGVISKKDYSKLIRNLKLFFEGKKNALVKNLEKDMKEAAKAEEFEKAADIKRTIFSLKHIKDISLIKRDNVSETGIRIEAYDIAHIGEKDRVGVMTVIEGGLPDKSQYRKFKIKKAAAGDVAALEEVIERRLNHDEWPLPKILVVDGGKAQINTALKIFNRLGLKIPVVSVLKDERHKPKGVLGESRVAREYESEILLANSEAHRFGLAYHRKIRNNLS